MYNKYFKIKWKVSRNGKVFGFMFCFQRSSKNHDLSMSKQFKTSEQKVNYKLNTLALSSWIYFELLYLEYEIQ